MKFILSLFVATTLWLYALPSDITYLLNESKIPSRDVSIYITDKLNLGAILTLNDADENDAYPSSDMTQASVTMVYKF